MTSRSWCFTLNNPTVEEIEVIDTNENRRYTIYGYEIGENGTPHLQGYIEMNSPVRQAAIKKILGNRAHIEKRHGDRESARRYCIKDGNWIEFGEWESGGQGTRNDLTTVMKLCKEQKPVIKIMEELPTAVCRNLRFFEKYYALCEKEQTRGFRRVSTHVLIGEAGTGKSRIANEMSEHKAFTVNPEDSFPFDGYDGEETIIIDDFEGQLKYKHLLKILDGHQLRVNVKGGHRYAKWTKVFITTNERAEGWYQRGLTAALARRLTTVTTFGHEELGNTEPAPEEKNEVMHI